MPHMLKNRMRCSPPTLRPEATKELVQDAVRSIWREYKHRRSDILRSRLILYYMQGHVRRIAARLHKLLPSQVDLDDLVQQGYLGLIDSMERYDPDRNVTFETFSSQRIAGAIHDYLRKIDPLPRMTRTRLKAAQRTEDDFRKRHGRAPSEEELRERMGVSPPAFRQYQSDLAASAPASLHPHGQHESGPTDGDGPGGIVDRRQDVPLVAIERANVRDWINRGLDHRDRLIVLLYYYEHLTMREVGTALGISESRVSQRLDLIHERIRSRLSLAEAEREMVMEPRG